MENKIEKEDKVLGDFLSNNSAACNLESFHDLVGWSKESFNRIIDKKHVKGRNCVLLARRDDPDGRSGLQLIHSLFIGKDQ